ncbi:MAG: type I-E CRISPR-associated protein Cas6/Cse3/CasE [Gemmatimonadaceae bacterium]|jgi:CRISPR system Cascade subunit CasE
MLHMLSFSPDASRFARFAARERLLPTGEDTGYAWHAVLSAAFGADVPKPFTWFPPRTREGGSGGRLLCYSGHHLDVLRVRAEEFADPLFLDILRMDDASVKSMPTRYAEGRAFGFRIRVRPTVRTGAGRDGQRARERDAFDPATGEERTVVYGRWLAAALARHGAAMLDARAEALQLTSLLTRSRRDGHGQRRSTLGPDVTYTGALRVENPALFAAVMARGVGRHRAFGFGMLLLRPS